MIRLTWLQFRVQTAVAAAGLAIVAIIAAVTGPHLLHLYHATVTGCAAYGTCDTATTIFLRNDQLLRSSFGILVVVIPGIIGVFWGAPLVARELETGTYRLAWTQSITRTRWLAVKLSVIGLASMAVAGLLSLIVTWWASPLDKAAANRFNPGVFDERGIVAIGYAALACLLGVTAGVLIRRTLPAMATALAAFVVARLAITYWLRPHLLAASHTTVPLSTGSGLGFTPGSAGMTFTAGNPTIANAWVLSTRIVDNAGHPATPQVLNQFLQTACPAVANPSAPPPGVTRGPANQNTFQQCIDRLSTRFHLQVNYQHANRYWTFQGIELAICVTVALALAGFCLWWIRRRHA
jgi:hypothetical protein